MVGIEELTVDRILKEKSLLLLYFYLIVSIYWNDSDVFLMKTKEFQIKFEVSIYAD